MMRKIVALTILSTFSLKCWAGQMDLWEICNCLKTKKFIDLTHTFHPSIPHWPGFPDEKIETLYWYEKGVGSIGAGFCPELLTNLGKVPEKGAIAIVSFPKPEKGAGFPARVIAILP